MLFSQGGKKGGETKNRSLLGTLFGVEIVSDLRSLREQAGMFVRMIASIFSMGGLFPKDHPALTDMRLRLTMADVVSTAWRNVRFTRENVPQTALFLAVVGTMALTGLFLVSVIFSLFIGKAHAQSMFTPPDPTRDWGKGVLDYLAFGVPLPNEFSYGGSADCSFHDALGTALAYFSTAVLVIAGIILLYHLVSMVVKTAQTGQPFAGANHVWGPIRLVFAIALLVPIATSSGGSPPVTGGCQMTGYNVGQYLAFSVAQWGSGLASRIWSNFQGSLNTFSTTSTCKNPVSTPHVITMTGARPTEPPSCVKGNRNLRTAVASLIVFDACAKYASLYLQQAMPNATTPPTIYDSQTGMNGFDPLKPGFHPFGYVKSWGWFGVNKTKDFCGGYEILEEPDANNVFAPIYKAMYAIGGPFDILLRDVNDFNTNYRYIGIDGSNFFWPTYSNNPSHFDTAAVERDYEEMVTNFEKGVEKAIQDGITASETNTINHVQNAYQAGSHNFGWIFAGSTFNAIARTQAQKFEMMRNILPIPRLPEFLNKNIVNPNPPAPPPAGAAIGVPTSVQNATEMYREILQNDLNVSMDTNMATTVPSPNGRTHAAASATPGLGDVFKIATSNNASGVLGNLFIASGEKEGLWDSNGTLAISFGLQENPIIELTALGNRFISYAVWGLIAGIAISAIPGVGGFLSGIIVFVISTAFSVGFSLAYLVPLYAFYRFFFGVVSWMMTVFEAIVLVPLFALAHVNPGGEGLQGPRGAYGYSVAMQLLLRPTLMVFGLIAGYLLFKAALSLLNPAFILASVGSGNMSGFGSVFSKLAYSIIYATLVVILANQCFKLIGLFPQTALRWLGLGPIQEEKVGDPQMLAAAGAWVAKQGASQVASSATGIMPAIQKARADKVAEEANELRVGREVQNTKSLQTIVEQQEQGIALQKEIMANSSPASANPSSAPRPHGQGGNANLGPNLEKVTEGFSQKEGSAIYTKNVPEREPPSGKDAGRSNSDFGYRGKVKFDDKGNPLPLDK